MGQVEVVDGALARIAELEAENARLRVSRLEEWHAGYVEGAKDAIFHQRNPSAAKEPSLLYLEALAEYESEQKERAGK